MNLVIEIDMDNAAFDDTPVAEVKRILGTCIPKLQEQMSRPDALCNALEWSDKLYDVNGNCIGTIKLND